MIRPILQAPDPMLYRPSAPVEIGSVVHDTIADLIDTRISVKAAGLAAPQIGVALRIISVAPSAFFGFTILINPLITAHGNHRRTEPEGCMSIGAGVPRFEVPRWDTITVQFTDRKGVPREVRARSFGARLIQHEIDHLDGKLIA